MVPELFYHLLEVSCH